MTIFSDLPNFVDGHRRLFVLTGAGCSTGSGIPDYRDAEPAYGDLAHDFDFVRPPRPPLLLPLEPMSLLR